VQVDRRAKRYRFTTEIDHGFPVLIAMMRLKNSSLARRSGATWLRGTLRRMKEQLNPDDEDDLSLADAIINGNEPGRLAGPAARQRYKLLRTLAGIKNQARKSRAKSTRQKE
jgi:hypothetical protein